MCLFFRRGAGGREGFFVLSSWEGGNGPSISKPNSNPRPGKPNGVSLTPCVQATRWRRRERTKANNTWSEARVEVNSASPQPRASRCLGYYFPSRRKRPDGWRHSSSGSETCGGMYRGSVFEPVACSRLKSHSLQGYFGFGFEPVLHSAVITGGE